MTKNSSLLLKVWHDYKEGENDMVKITFEEDERFDAVGPCRL